MFDRKVFYSAIRAHMPEGRLTAEQVTGLEAKLSVWEQFYDAQPVEYLACCLAQCKWETGGRMYPVVEAFNMHEPARSAYLTNLYDVNGANPTRARANGNVNPGDGVKYCGQGDIQLTWACNYRKLGTVIGVDLVAQPELARDPVHSAHIMFAGMIGGLFTKYRLADFMKNGKLDAYKARAVVNGDAEHIPKGEIQTIGAVIASDYSRFLAALKLAQNSVNNTASPVVAVAAPAPEPVQVPMPSTAPSLIGGLIAGLARNAVATVAANPAVPHINADNIEAVTTAITAAATASPELNRVSEAVAQAATPVPWYRSSVMNGIIVAALCSYISGKFGVTVPDEWRPLFETVIGQLGVFAGLAVATVGRLTSKAQPVTLTQK